MIRIREQTERQTSWLMVAYTGPVCRKALVGNMAKKEVPKDIKTPSRKREDQRGQLITGTGPKDKTDFSFDSTFFIGIRRMNDIENRSLLPVRQSR